MSLKVNSPVTDFYSMRSQHFVRVLQMATIRTQPQSYLDEYGEDFFRDPVALGSRTVVKYDVNYNSAAISCLSLSLAFLSAMVKFL